MTTTDQDYKQFCEQRLVNPYPFFARLREEDPVHWCEPMKMWLVTRYDDVFDGLRDVERLSSNREAMYRDPLTPKNRRLAQRLVDHLGNWMLNVDAPRHTRLRKLVNIAFTPRMLRSMEPRVECLVHNLLDEICASRQTDFVARFCLPLPATVICDMLGIPDDQQQLFRRCVAGLIPFSSAGGPGLNDHIDEASRSLDTLIVSFEQLIEDRRRLPQEDLISAMAAAEAEGDRLTKDELFALCVFLFLAGHETTMGLLGNGTLALLQYPDEFEKLKANTDDLIDSAVEEFLRYESPVTRGARLATQDFLWRGKSIQKGQTVTMLLGSANHDPEKFPDPDTLDIERHPNQHLSFGFGTHFCLGAQLARIEAQIAFRAMMQRLPEMQLDTDCIEYQPAMGIRSLKSLPVRFR